MAATLIGFTGLSLRGEMPELMPLIPVWDGVFNASSGAGYRDNVFFSSSDPQPSPFLWASAEAMAFRLAPNSPRFTVVGSADVKWFIAEEVNHTEYLGFAQLQAEHSVGEAWTLELNGAYAFQDQMLDVSVTQTNQEAVQAVGHRAVLRPEARWDLSPAWWLAVEVPITRQFFEAPLDDYWEAGTRWLAGRRLGGGTELNLVYQPSWLRYDDDPALTETGDAITGSQRERFQQEVRLEWRQRWDARNQWRTDLGAGVRVNEENGGGYFDFVRWSSSARVVYSAGGIRASAEARVDDYHYANQPASTTDNSRLRRTLLLLSARLEASLTRRLAAILSYEYEREFSNDPLEPYAVNTVLGGVAWEF